MPTDTSTPAAVGLAAAVGVPTVSPSMPASVLATASPPAGPVAFTKTGDRNPTVLSTTNPVKVGYTGADPLHAELSDDTTSTYHFDAESRPPTSSGTLSIAARIEETLPAPLGAITHIIIRGLGFAVRYAVSTISNPRVEYGSPGQSKVLTTFTTHNNLAGMTFATAWREIATDPITTRPDGQPWTWADVIVLGDLTFKADFSIPFDGNAVELYVHEVWADVYGAVGSTPDVIKRTIRIGPTRRTVPISL